jgi:hypothetical protein
LNSSELSYDCRRKRLHAFLGHVWDRAGYTEPNHDGAAAITDQGRDAADTRFVLFDLDRIPLDWKSRIAC